MIIFVPVKVRRYIFSALSALAVVLSATGCGVSKVRDIKVTSLDFKYITPTSSRSLDAVLLVGIDNPAPAITVSGLEGTIRLGERPLVLITAGELTLEKKCEKVYELPCTAALAEGASLISLLPLISQSNMGGAVADVKLHLALKDGPGTDLVFNDLSISKLMK